MSLYTFDTVLLSAAKTGEPNLMGTQLSAFGVNTISLSSNDVGVAFNKVGTLVNALSTLNVKGSVIKIDKAYDASDIAIVKTDGTYDVFTFKLGSAATIPLSAISTTVNVSTQDTRRKWHLGYK